MISIRSRGGLWLRVAVAVLLYLAALFWLVMVIPFVAKKWGPLATPMMLSEPTLFFCFLPSSCLLLP